MKFDIITIFPDIFSSYLSESILKRAVQKKKIEIKTHNPRVYATDTHKSVDDRPYGGGPGMILMFSPFYKTLQKIKKRKKSKIILLTPAGKQFTQRDAERYTTLDQLILISGRYEGFDERIERLADEKISVGPYVLSGGELPALTIVEAVTRLLPGVLGHADSATSDTFAKSLEYVEYPQYTRPEKVKVKGKNWCVPKVLLSGDHKAIAEWRQKKCKN
jgi:tRNA (guanine37-N1)-methyltransferase